MVSSQAIQGEGSVANDVVETLHLGLGRAMVDWTGDAPDSP